MRRFLLTILVATAACTTKPSSVKVDPLLDTLVPSDTVLLVGTRLEKLVKTPVYQKNFDARQIPQIEEFSRRTGIDPRKDLWELLFVSNAKNGVLLGRGHFADEMMEPRLEKEGATRMGYKGLNLYGNDQGAVVLLSPTLAALGRVDDLHNLIDHKSESHGPPPAMAALLKEIPANAQFWAAYSGGPLHLPFDPNSNLANINKLVSSVETGTLYFDLSTGLNGILTANCSSDDGGEQVESAFKALIGIGRLSVPKNQPDLAAVYNTIRVTRESKRVKLYIDVPEAMADKFLGMWLGSRH
ncbi:MAG: hypothetical protein LAO79_11520 [Acidobacteriia bacterium]|nr:hypothetical protein [Terriglobia bacterium]